MATVPTRAFTHREFAFTLSNDAYLRYNSFQTAADLQREVVRLNPSRFEIGPVYSGRPRDRKTLAKAAFKPVMRELVFDIDMTDYDEIRTCCSDKSICKRCWRFIAMAVKVLDVTLRDDFGFKHLLWVYSGRRGIHCWISDKAALRLTDDERKAMVNYLEVVKGGAKQDKKVDLGRRPLHPAMTRSLEVLKGPFVETVLNDQEAFKAKDKWEALLRAVPDKGADPGIHNISYVALTAATELAATLTAKWGSENLTSTQMWVELRDSVPKTKQNAIKSDRHGQLIEDLVMQHAYPRIDVEVSKHLNHLLKSPFVVHPGTGRVCVPLDPKKVDDFDPEKVPDVRDILRDLDKKETEARKRGESVDTAGPAWDQTALKPYVELFDRHVQGILKETAEIKRGEYPPRLLAYGACP